MRGGRAVAASALVALSFSIAPVRAQEADYPCAGDLSPLRYDKAPSFGLVSLLVPPLLFLEAAARDEVSDRPRHEVSVSVAAAKDLPAGTTRIAILLDGTRHLGDLEPGAKTRLPEGRYVFQAARTIGGGTVVWGRTQATIGAKGARRFEVSLDRRLVLGQGVRVGQTAPDGRAPAASVITLDWEGDWQSDARVSFAPSNKPTIYATGPVRVGADRPAQVEVPAAPGAYDVRLELCAPRISLARQPLVVAAADVRLEAPSTVKAGEAFQVASLGRNGLEFTVAMIEADGEEVASRTLDLGEPSGELIAPMVPGRYRLVRRTGGDAPVVLAETKITVEPAAIEIRAPEKVATGAPVAIEWTGAGGATRLELWRPAAGSHPAKRLRDDLDRGEKPLPAGPGTYELRVVATSGDHPVLARRSILVEGAFFTQAPERLAPGEHWAVGLAQKPGFFDELVIVPRGGELERFDDARSFDAGSTRAVEIVAPERPGAYDLLMVAKSPTEEPVVLDRRPFEVK